MEMLSEFTIDHAGQGLFYHGIINSNKSKQNQFPIVYDCGTGNSTAQIDAKKRSGSLTGQIDKFKRSFTGQIGLLAISHFDYDHVSHIPELLRGTGAKTVMLPHVADELRLVFWAKTLFERGSSIEDSDETARRLRDLELLFRDPVGFFGEYGGESRIIGIDGSDGGDDSDYPPFDPSEIEPYEKRPLDEYPPLRYLAGAYGKPSTPDAHSKSYTVYRGSPAFRLELGYLSWLFRPINITERLPNEFYNDIAELLEKHKRNWSDLLADEIKALKSIYDKYIGKRNRNSHSLLVRHEPEQRSLFSDENRHACECYWISCFDCYDSIRHMNRFRRFCDYRHGATLLLGDVVLDVKAKTLLRRNKFIDFKLGVTLIPHHGAVSEDVKWLDKKIYRHKRCKSILAVSYGNGNKYGHPKFLYDGTVAEINSSLIFVNERQPYHCRIISWTY